MRSSQLGFSHHFDGFIVMWHGFNLQNSDIFNSSQLWLHIPWSLCFLRNPLDKTVPCQNMSKPWTKCRAFVRRTLLCFFAQRSDVIHQKLCLWSHSQVTVKSKKWKCNYRLFRKRVSWIYDLNICIYCICVCGIIGCCVYVYYASQMISVANVTHDLLN